MNSGCTLADRGRRNRVRDAWQMGRKRGPAIDMAHNSSPARSRPARIMMGPELGLPRRDIDPNRAIGFAALARQAQRQRVYDNATDPPLGDDFAARHLVQQMRAPSGGMLFLASRE